jgi:hypothetical protein
MAPADESREDESRSASFAEPPAAGLSTAGSRQGQERSDAGAGESAPRRVRPWPRARQSQQAHAGGCRPGDRTPPAQGPGAGSNSAAQQQNKGSAAAVSVRYSTSSWRITDRRSDSSHVRRFRNIIPRGVPPCQAVVTPRRPPAVVSAHGRRTGRGSKDVRVGAVLAFRSPHLSASTCDSRAKSPGRLFRGCSFEDSRVIPHLRLRPKASAWVPLCGPAHPPTGNGTTVRELTGERRLRPLPGQRPGPERQGRRLTKRP